MGAARTAIVLIGLRRSGKSSLGLRLAQELRYDFIDLDTLVHRRTGRTPAAWMSARPIAVGEAAFRTLEAEALQALLDAGPRDGLVLAAGGGTPTWAPSAALLQQLGTVIHLELSADEAAQRAALDPNPEQRPLLAGGTAEEEARLLHAERTPLFRRLAATNLDASGPPDSVFSALLALFHH